MKSMLCLCGSGMGTEFSISADDSSVRVSCTSHTDLDDGANHCHNCHHLGLACIVIDELIVHNSYRLPPKSLSGVYSRG